MFYLLKSLAIISTVLRLTILVTAQFNDDISFRKIRLQDLENEQNQREYQRDETERLQQQQPPPLPLLPYLKPLQTSTMLTHPLETDYTSFPTKNYDFDVDSLKQNSQPIAADIFSDLDTFPRAASYPSSGSAIFAADVLLPPFHENEDTSFLIGNDLTDHLSSSNIFGSSSSLFPNDPSLNGPINLFGSDDVIKRPNDITGNLNEHFPVNQLVLKRPAVQYGSPQANFRHPRIFSQSKQFAFAPAYATKTPFPPSFVCITAQRPSYRCSPSRHNQLGYKSKFRPSPIDPLPDIFTKQQSQYLMDSSIQSWIIRQMLQAQNYHQPSLNPFFKRADNKNGFFYNKYLNTDPTTSRKDEVNDENTKIVKKLIGTPSRNSMDLVEEMMMTD